MKILQVLILGGLMSAVSVNAGTIPKHYEEVLENGLQVVVVPLQNKSSVIEVDVIYKVGSRNEAKGKSGIAHMLEHLNFKSTKNLKAGEFDEIVKKFGGVDNAYTIFDYTKYYIKTTNKNLAKSLELFAEVMENLTLSDEEFQPERNVVLQERLWRTDNNPTGLLYFEFFNTAFEKHPYHWTPIGFKEDIQAWRLEDIIAFHNIYYQPQNAIVLVSGDVEPKEVFANAKKYFGKIKNKTDSIPQVSIKEPAQNAPKFKQVQKQSEVEYLAMGYKIPNYLHKDQVALSAISEILSKGNSSLFQVELIDKKQLASGISAYNMELKDEGVFFIMALANQNVSAKTLQNEIITILERIKKGEISQEELEKVKISTKASFVYSFEDAASTAGVFANYLAKGDLKPLFEYESAVENLSIEEIALVAQKYFVPNTLTTAVIYANKDTKKSATN